jgi:hypothetical protein
LREILRNLLARCATRTGKSSPLMATSSNSQD